MPVLFALMTAALVPSSYCNARFAYCLTAPSFLVGQGESDNGDGQVFLDRRRAVKLTVWGDLNALGDTLGKRYERAARTSASRRVTYKTLRSSWFVVSGTEGGRVFYQRTMLDAPRNVYATFLLEYPIGDKTAEAAIRSLSSSFVWR
ncbi:hypothetical protein [Deinococcus yavapaiensis]|uniref:Secreted protein n=1 Tax=Deinococcus yavapaiensis KR-236 TaxID=694435 RepID=A0A318S1E0_9DEIO|nr:hypothetical protein [Deinococcus yavapaiensis]PYE49963.1 hypothetical protein DES52_12048 [Deinococcus yavapaiensis KR-236]